MSIIQYIRRLLNSSTKDYYDIPKIEDEPPAYDEPPPYENLDNYKEPSKKKKIIDTYICNIINNIRNNKYNMGCLILDEKKISIAKIIKYLFENYSTNNDIMIYMIKNHKHNHTISIGKNKIMKTCLDNHQNRIFIIGAKDLNIYINDKVFNFNKYKCGIFSAIFINENGWQGNAIHHIAAFNETFNFENFEKLF